MKSKIKKFLANIRRKALLLDIKARQGLLSVETVLADDRGESQNTSSAGAVVVSLLVIAAAILWITGYAQTFFSTAQSKFSNLWGK